MITRAAGFKGWASHADVLEAPSEFRYRWVIKNIDIVINITSYIGMIDL